MKVIECQALVVISLYLGYNSKEHYDQLMQMQKEVVDKGFRYRNGYIFEEDQRIDFFFESCK